MPSPTTTNESEDCVKVRSYYPYKAKVDDEEIPLRLKVLTFDEAEELQRNWDRFQNPTADRFIFRKADEQEKTWSATCRAKDCEFAIEPSENETDVRMKAADHERANAGHKVKVEASYVVPDVTIINRRKAEMTPDQREKFEAAQKADHEFNVRFIKDAFSRFVTVESNLTRDDVDEHGKPVEVNVTKGEDFLMVMGARRKVWFTALHALVYKNVLGDFEKKVSPSPIDSSSSSSESDPARAGMRPATTAENAVSEDSAPSEDAESLSSVPSGSTAPTSSRPAPSSS